MLQRAQLHESVHSPDEDEVDAALVRRVEALPDATLGKPAHAGSSHRRRGRAA